MFIIQQWLICCFFLGEKKLAKSGLFLAAISEIAAKKEQKNVDERNISTSETDEKQTDTTEERNTGELLLLLFLLFMFTVL